MLSLYFVSVFSVGGRRHPRNARGMGNGTRGNLAIDLANTPAGGEALGRLQAVVALTDAERLGFGTWTQGELKKLSRVPPPILWHYTDGNSLIAILKSGALWATQVSCLNDYSELSYAMRLVRTELEQQRIAHSNNRPVLLMLDSAIDGLQDRHAATNEWFVACLSENGDDLSQWRGYGAGEGGYSIGLSSGALAVAGAQQSHFLAPVNYDAPTHAALARAIALEIFKTFNQGLSAVPARANVLATWIDQFLDAWKNRLTYIAPILKDPAFRAEQEWRIVHRLQDDDVRKLEFRQKRTLMARHLPLHFRPPDGSDVLPIAQIKVGPSRNADVSRISVGDLLKAKGYGTTTSVVTSTIPYQSP